MGMFPYVCTKCGPKDDPFDWMECCVVKLMKYTTNGTTAGDIYVRGRYDGYGEVKVAVAAVQQQGGDCGDGAPASAATGATTPVPATTTAVVGAAASCANATAGSDDDDDVDDASNSATVVPLCHFHLFGLDYWDDDWLVATKIYCNGNFITTNGGGGGDGEADMTNRLRLTTKGRTKINNALFSSSLSDFENDMKVVRMLAHHPFCPDDFESGDDYEIPMIRICVPENVTVLDELTQEQYTHAAAVSATFVKRAYNKQSGAGQKKTAAAADDHHNVKAPTTPTPAADGDDSDNDNDETLNEMLKALGIQ
jgi:hypothetical protein